MIIASDKKPTSFWSERDFWFHLLILFAVFVYLYSPLLDHSFDHYTHSRPHNHIPVKLVKHGDHYHLSGDTSHAGSATADEHICSLDFTGLILLSLFIAFIVCGSQTVRNVLVYKIETDSAEIVLNERPPPNPPPRSLSLLNL